MAQTPRWTDAELHTRHVSRPTRGVIVLAYSVTARRAEGGEYHAHCTTTWRRFAKGDWQVVQHQQTPPLSVPAA